MATIEARQAEFGLTLPPAFAPPPGVSLPFVHHTVEIAGEPYWDGGYVAPRPRSSRWFKPLRPPMF